MILTSKAELAGRVKLQISGGARGTIDYPWQDNMILDQGFRALLDGTITPSRYAFEHFSVGSSSQPVQPADTGCLAPVYRFPFSPETTESGWDDSGGFGWTRTTKTSPRGAAAGNISELTCGWGNNNVSAFARALVRDAEGNPTTITILPDEVLTLTWELRRWWISSSPHSVGYTIDGTPHETLVSYMTESLIDKSTYGLGSGGVTGFEGALVSDFVGEKSVVFSENSGNPEIATVPTLATQNRVTFPRQSFTLSPPIPKTNAFTCTVYYRLALSRRAP